MHLRMALKAKRAAICRTSSGRRALTVAIAVVTVLAAIGSGQAAEGGSTIRKHHRVSANAHKTPASPAASPESTPTPGLGDSSSNPEGGSVPSGGYTAAPAAAAAESTPAAEASPPQSTAIATPASRPSPVPVVSGDRAAADGQSPLKNFGLNADHGPIDIRSDSMDLDYKGNQITFKGHVHVKQSGTLLNSDTLQVTYGGNFHEMKEIVALGHVKMEQGGRWASGDRAVLDQLKHTVEMTGSPVIHDGQDSIAGDRILIYLESQKSVVEGARAVIFPRKSENRDNDHNDQGP